jgi:hypothetical protein
VAKGGNFENITARKLAKAFAIFGVKDEDFYRTKNSGASKSHPGDVQPSPFALQFIPATFECKHYKKIEWKLGKSISLQPKSYCILDWWKQVQKEERQTSNRFGLLIMRQNNCPDIVAFCPAKLKAIFAALNMRWFSWTRATFRSVTITSYCGDEIWIVNFAEFLREYVLHLRWYTLSGSLEFRKESL